MELHPLKGSKGLEAGVVLLQENSESNPLQRVEPLTLAVVVPVWR
jgi:hypothetical protein